MGIITMKHNRLGYYIKEGVSSIFTHGFMSFASVCVIVACLIIMGSFSLLSMNVEEIVQTMEDENEMLAFVDENLSEEEARALESQIEANPNVANAVFVSREEAMESFINAYSNKSLFDGLTPEVLRHRYIIYLNDISKMAETQTALLGIYGIATVNAHIEISEAFVKIERIITTVSILLVAILFIVSLFIMSNTIKLTTFERKDEIAIMKMVGATSSFIRWPFVVEGLILGTFGSLIAYILQWGIYRVLTDKILSATGFSFMTTVPFSVIAIPLLVVFLILGFCVGVIGSLIAIKNYLKV
jgi:cell division transport system permease protein